MTIKTVQQGQRSMMRYEEFNTRKKRCLLRGVYGLFLMCTSLFLIGIDPVQTITDWYLRMEEDSFVFRMWKDPPYQLYLKVHVFNYTNVAEFLSGEHTKLKLEEVGPFYFQEKRTNKNMSIDTEREVLKLVPNITLSFLPDRSVGNTTDVRVIVPNLALIALSTLAADKLPWWTNQLAHSLLSGMGSQLFLNLTVQEYLWDYQDPLVSIASTIAPGWIDFGRIGILDRLYDEKPTVMELELSDRDKHKYSVVSYGGVAGLREQGFEDINTSIPCNLIKGSYEGLMLNPGVPKDFEFRLFRKQTCRLYPFHFENEDVMDSGLTYYRFTLDKSSFNTSSPFACHCDQSCLPDGFVDISNCFYNFPIALTKPHYLDVDPRETARYEGLKPDRTQHTTFMDFEPTLGIPVKLQSALQANIAVRTSRYNPITKPLDKHILPLIWFSMNCDELPEIIASVVKLRILYAPPAIITVEAVLMILGVWLVVSSLRRYYSSSSTSLFLETKEKISLEYDKASDALL